jgi:hypothetical protein
MHLEDLVSGLIVQHHSGTRYSVHGVAEGAEEPGRLMVVYQSLTTGKLYYRPARPSDCRRPNEFCFLSSVLDGGVRVERFKPAGTLPAVPAGIDEVMEGESD